MSIIKLISNVYKAVLPASLISCGRASSLQPCGQLNMFVFLPFSPESRSFGYRLKVFAALQKLGVTVTHDNLDN